MECVWALVHGPTFLRLDGKFDASSSSAVATTAAVSAVLGQLA